MPQSIGDRLRAENSDAAGEGPAGEGPITVKRATAFPAAGPGEREFRLLVASIKDYAIIMLDPQGRIVSWNEGARRRWGYEEPEIVGQPIERLYPPEVAAAGTPARLLALAVKEGRCDNQGWRQRKDGTRFFADVIITALRDDTGNLVGFAKVTRDITDRRNIEEALRISEGQLKRAQHLAHMGSDLRDLRTGERSWSDECYEIFGVSRDTFAPTPEAILELIHPEDRPLIMAQRAQVAAGLCPGRMEYRIVRPDGTLRYVTREWEMTYDDDGRPAHLLGAIHDITDRRHTEEQLRQAQKMEAIGNLTGGMAHDFNNLLGIIIGNLDFARDMATEDDLREVIAEALDAALRGADLTRRLLAFARRQPLRPAQLDINKLISSTTTLLRRVLGERIEISIRLSQEVSQVIVDPAQFEASLTNLATNARDAMPRGGRLIIATANRELDEDYAALHPEVTPGQYALIEVSDTGTGMTPEILKQIFEPFFTTKETGKGTGLGLSMVFGFIKQSGGHIAVYSEPGRGTTFQLYLPRVTTGQEDGIGEATAGTAVKGGRETVLVVEDNPGMLRIVTRQLGELGYRVIECERAEAALDLLQNNHVDLLLTDIVTPGSVDGIELAKLVRERWPAVKIVLTSGFPQARIEENGGVPGDFQLISKPYRRKELATAIRTALDG